MGSEKISTKKRKTAEEGKSQNNKREEKKGNRMLRFVKHPISVGRVPPQPHDGHEISNSVQVVRGPQPSADTRIAQFAIVVFSHAAWIEVTDQHSHNTNTSRTEKDGFVMFALVSGLKNCQPRRGNSANN